MKPEIIIAIVIPCIMIIGAAIFHIIDFFQKDESLKQLNEEKARVLNNIMCSSKHFEVALDQMRDCANRLTVSEIVDTISDEQKEVMDFLVHPPVSDDVLTFEATMSPNEMRKMLGLDEIEEHEATIKDFTIKKVETVVTDYSADVADYSYDDVEPKSKKLQPLLCKMCGGTVAKKGDNYECEYCGLKYEWR